MGIFDDEAVFDSLSPEHEEALGQQLDEQEEGQNQEPASQEGPAEGVEGQPEGPTATEGQPSTGKPDPLAKFTSDFALAKSYVEIKKALGEPNDLENYKTRDELGAAYLEAERRLGSRGKPTTTAPQPEDDRYNTLQQQLAQTERLLIKSSPGSAGASPGKPGTTISQEDQEFIQNMEEIYPGFSQYMERMIMERVRPQLEPIQKLANEYDNRSNSSGWQAVAARNADFKDYIPED